MAGFTLLEMAMVLAIIGLILGAAISATTVLMKSSKISTTQTKENTIKAALINFIAVNNRLPCPADPTGVLAAPGVEVINTATTPKSCNVNTSVTLSTATAPAYPVYTGVVPWASLGLTQEGATDAYFHFFTYLVAQTAIQTVPAAQVTKNVPSISGLKGAISIYSQGAAGSLTLANQINNCMSAAYVANTNITSPYNPCSAVVALISHGPDGLGAYTTNGAAATVQYTDEQLNASHTSQIVIHDIDAGSSNPFDDIILPMTSSDLLSPLTANGTIPTYNALLNLDFANINSAIANYLIANKILICTQQQQQQQQQQNCSNNYNTYTVLSADSVLDYPVGIFTPNAQTQTPVFYYLPSSYIYDPWGNLISYTAYKTNGQSQQHNQSTNITCSLTNYPVQIYSLTSYGPDGLTTGLASDDDISMKITFSQLVPVFNNNGTGC
jgi:prepilin-type N-terminal cleavage/methylation domain-containing protein